MLNPFLRYTLGLAALLAWLTPAAAQQPNDPLTRFLDGVFKNPARTAPQAPAEQPQAAPATRAAPARQPTATRTQKPAVKETQRSAPQKAAAPKPEPNPPQLQAAPQPKAEPKQEAQKPPAASPVAPEPPKAAAAPPAKAAEPPKAEAKLPEAKPAPEAKATPAPDAKPAEPPPAKVAEPPRAPAPQQEAAKAAEAPAATPVATRAPASPAIPASPAAALERVNEYFNGIDQLTAYFVQKNPNGQQVEGTLAVKRPGILQFAYAPPSTLEIVSDGRNVAIRDKKLGTNDVYPVGQTPLKFLLQENVNLGRDTKVRDVQVGRDGMVTVRFDDNATFGGTSRITLRFDARANALRQWSIVDSQGYETTVTLSNLNVVPKREARAVN
jgi:outer membrane lipoprotein-sorting protein